MSTLYSAPPPPGARHEAPACALPCDPEHGAICLGCALAYGLPEPDEEPAAAPSVDFPAMQVDV
jgi:hypothetical protein